MESLFRATVKPLSTRPARSDCNEMRTNNGTAGFSAHRIVCKCCKRIPAVKSDADRWPAGQLSRPDIFFLPSAPGKNFRLRPAGYAQIRIRIFFVPLKMASCSHLIMDITTTPGSCRSGQNSLSCPDFPVNVAS